MPLNQEHCEACRADAPKVGPGEARELVKEIEGWALVEVEAVPQLHKSYRFSDFAQALAFANRVGALAEAEQHHPEIVVGWGQVSVRWWTHKIRGLHRNDFVMAARTDECVAA